MSTAIAVSTPERIRGRALTSHFWMLATPLTALLVGFEPLLSDQRYYFRGDTQVAYSGWWYELGNQVLHGHLPLLSPQSWESGNYVAEGQWGLFSPLTILIGIAFRVAPNAVAVATLLKLALIMLCALGMYLLLRSYRVSATAAYVGGVLVGLGGQSVYYDWPAWANGEMAAALLPWAWWLTRRAMRGRNPLPALLACYLLVTIGYVYAALYLAIVIVVCLVDAGVARDRAAFLRALGLGAFSALVVLTVYLPGVLTASVTVRSGFAIKSAGAYPFTVGNLLTSMLPTTGRLYLLWCLPLVLWIDPARARTALRDLRGALVGTAIVLAWILGPNKIGPLRWPSRVMPALMVVLVVLLVVVVARSIGIPGRARILASLAWLLAATWVVISLDWQAKGKTVLGAAVVAAAIVVVAWSLRRRAVVAGVAIGVCTVAVFVTQHAVTPEVTALDRHSPARAAGYKTQLAAARGDVMVIGNYDASLARTGSLAKELLVGSTWYRNPAAVQNGYSTIEFRKFREQFCMTYNGFTCKHALAAVLAEDPTTGKPWVDLLSISTLVMYRPDFTDSRLRPPTGWTVAATSRSTITWVRDNPLPSAGGVVSTSAGVRVAEQYRTTQKVGLRVESVPPGGGTVVFSRLAWPGYTVSGASLASPTDKFLVTVHLNASDAGHTVTLAWSPPGWRAEVTAWWLAILGGLAWSVAVVVLSVRARRRRRAPALSGGSGQVGELGEFGDTGELGDAREDDAPVEPPSGGSREDEPDHIR